MAKNTKSKHFALRAALALAGITLAIFAVHLFMQYLNLNVYHEQNGLVFELSNRLDLDDESSVPTWFSQTLLFTIGVGALTAAYLQKQKAKRRLWALIGTLGILLSIDEAASLHEFALQSLHNVFFLDTSPTADKNAWVLIIPIILIFALVLAWQSIRLLPKRTVAFFVLGGAVFVAGAVIIDILSINVEANTFLYQGVMVGIEEFFELLGSIIVLFSIADYIETYHKDDIAETAKRLKVQDASKA